MNMLASTSDDMVALSIPILAIGGSFVVAIFAIVSKAIRQSIETRHKEESRREIAAYVAEGTMSPDDAYKILSAGTNPKGRSCC